MDAWELVSKGQSAIAAGTTQFMGIKQSIPCCVKDAFQPGRPILISRSHAISSGPQESGDDHFHNHPSCSNVQLVGGHGVYS